MRKLKILFIIAIIVTSCERKNVVVESNQVTSELTVTESKYSTNNDSIVKVFVENFQPDSTLNGFKKMHNFPLQFISSVKALRKNGSTLEREKYLSLLYLKIYRGHLQCCHQSYEIRKSTPAKIAIDSLSDPILHEYNLITNQVDNSKSAEFISSGIVESWINQNPKLLSYSKINDEMKLIKAIMSNFK